jgi:hypothetical protein
VDRPTERRRESPGLSTSGTADDRFTSGESLPTTLASNASAPHGTLSSTRLRLCDCPLIHAAFACRRCAGRARLQALDRSRRSCRRSSACSRRVLERRHQARSAAAVRAATPRAMRRTLREEQPPQRHSSSCSVSRKRRADEPANYAAAAAAPRTSFTRPPNSTRKDILLLATKPLSSMPRTGGGADSHAVAAPRRIASETATNALLAWTSSWRFMA